MSAKFGVCPVRPILLVVIVFSLFVSAILMSDIVTKRNADGRPRPRSSAPFFMLVVGYGCYHFVLVVAVSRNDLKMMQVSRVLSGPVYWTASAADDMIRKQLRSREHFDPQIFRQTFYHSVHDGYRMVRFLLINAMFQYLAYVMLSLLWNHETYGTRMANRREFARLSQV